MFLDRGLVEAELAEFCGLVASPDCGVRLMVTRGGHRIWREEPVPPVFCRRDGCSRSRTA